MISLPGVPHRVVNLPCVPYRVKSPPSMPYMVCYIGWSVYPECHIGWSVYPVCHIGWSVFPVCHIGQSVYPICSQEYMNTDCQFLWPMSCLFFPMFIFSCSLHGYHTILLGSIFHRRSHNPFHQKYILLTYDIYVFRIMYVFVISTIRQSITVHYFIHLRHDDICGSLCGCASTTTISHRVTSFCSSLLQFNGILSKEGDIKSANNSWRQFTINSIPPLPYIAESRMVIYCTGVWYHVRPCCRVYSIHYSMIAPRGDLYDIE